MAMIRNSITGKIALVVALLSTSFLPRPALADTAEEPLQATPVGIDSSGEPLNAPASDDQPESSDDSGYTLPNIKGNTPSSIIDDDGRVHLTDTTAFPNSAVVYISREDQPHCTGWMISKDTLVTAGHCLYSPEKKAWYSGLQFSPGANGAERPFDTAQAVERWSDAKWISDGDSRLDWGVVKLDRSVGDETGWFGLMWRQAGYDGDPTELHGYPGDKPAGELWGMAGPVKKSQPNQLCYYTDTIGGQSGSPVYLQNRFFAIAIHAYGVGERGSNDLCPAEYNAGTRISESLYSVILNLR